MLVQKDDHLHAVVDFHFGINATERILNGPNAPFEHSRYFSIIVTMREEF